MATIGMDKLYYSKITESATGEETYATPVALAKAMKAEMAVEVNEATLFADDGVAEDVKEFKSGKLTLGVDDIGAQAAQDLTGASLDDNGVLVSAGEDVSGFVAIGFRARKSNGKYRYFWLYRVKFAVPSTNLETKGDGINFSTPTIEGTLYRRNKLDAAGNHPWKSEVTEGPRGLLQQRSQTGSRRFMNPHLPRPWGAKAMENDRSTIVLLGGQEYEMLLTTLATKQIAKRYGGLEKLGDKLLKTEDYEMALDEIVWLVTLLCNQGILIHNLRNPDAKKPLLTEDAVDVLTTPGELTTYKDAIIGAMFKGTKQHIESEPEKNPSAG